MQKGRTPTESEEKAEKEKRKQKPTSAAQSGRCHGLKKARRETHDTRRV